MVEEFFELILEDVDRAECLVDREQFLETCALVRGQILFILEEKVPAPLDVAAPFFALFLRFVQPDPVDDGLPVMGDDVKGIIDQGRLGAGLLDGFPVGVGHVDGHPFDRGDLVRRELLEKTEKRGLRATVPHPDQPSRLEIEDHGHVPMTLVDADLIDGQEPETVVAGSAHLLDEPALVDLLYRMPGE